MAEKTKEDAKADADEAALIAEIEAEDEERRERRERRRFAWGVMACTAFVCSMFAMTGAVLWVEATFRDREALMLESMECEAGRILDSMRRKVEGVTP
jgi:hypothetical protein